VTAVTAAHVGTPAGRHGAMHARWAAHVNGVGAPAALRGWLTDTGSLTVKLMASGEHFRVLRLRQTSGLCLADERAAIGLARRRQVQEREVVLHAGGRPVVYAHTVVPLDATASDWPFFGTLGERSLGTTLFGDPRVERGQLHYARLRPWHPLARRARAALDETLEGAEVDSSLQTHSSSLLYARRCLYRRRKGLLLVTEVFLPAIHTLCAVHRAAVPRTKNS
jgi:chorismate lyase